MSLIGQIFMKLLALKDVLIWMLNRACFWKPFGSERVNESEKLLKSVQKHFYPTLHHSEQIELEKGLFNQILNFRNAR